jgi:hypothetical protein
MAFSAGMTARHAAMATNPVSISGGRFEASGVVHVGGSSSVLFVDDGRAREVFWMELNPDGTQKSAPLAVDLGADVTDLEGITTDGQWFYAVGSQSKTSGFDGDGLIRFRFDARTHRAAEVQRIRGLKQWLADHVAELTGTGSRIGDTVLNIEGLAWDPTAGRLLLGLRAPVIDGQALIVPVRLRDADGPFQNDNLAVDGVTIRLSLDGAGIRSIEYDGSARAFRLITGAGLNGENRDFRILEWSGNGGDVREVATYSRKLKPEGIARVVLGTEARTMVVFDTGRFAVLD